MKTGTKRLSLQFETTVKNKLKQYRKIFDSFSFGLSAVWGDRVFFSSTFTYIYQITHTYTHTCKQTHANSNGKRIQRLAIAVLFKRDHRTSGGIFNRYLPLSMLQFV